MKLKKIHTGLLILSLVSCEKEKSRETQVLPTPARSTQVSIGNIPNEEKANKVWKRWRRDDSRQANLSTEALHDKLQRLSSLRYSEENRADFEFSIGELATRDPSAALLYFDPKKMRSGEPGLLFVASLLAQTAPDTLRNWLQNELQKGSLEVRGQSLIYGLMGLSTANPSEALKFYLDGKWDDETRDGAICTIFSAYGKESPLEAASAAEKFLKGADFDTAIRNVMIDSQGKDPETAMRLAAKIDNKATRQQAVGSVISKWIDSDPEKAIENLKSLNKEDLQNVLSYDVSSGTDRSIVKKLAETEPELVFELLRTIVPSSSNEEIFRGAVATLTTTNPDGVEEMLQSFQESDMKNRLIATQFSILAAENPGALSDQISRLGSDAAKDQACKALGQAANAGNFERLLAATGNLTVQQRTTFIANAIPQISWTDPQQAAQLLSKPEFAPDENTRNDLVTIVARNMAMKDGNAAENWMASMPEAQRPFVMKGIAREMAKNDLQGLAEFLGNSPKDASWKAGVGVLIENLSSSDPEMAKKWQETLDAEGK